MGTKSTLDENGNFSTIGNIQGISPELFGYVDPTSSIQDQLDSKMSNVIQYTPSISAIVGFTGTPVAKGFYCNAGGIVTIEGIVTGFSTAVLGGTHSFKTLLPVIPAVGSQAYRGICECIFTPAIGALPGVIGVSSTVPSDNLLICTFVSLLSLGAAVNVHYRYSYSLVP